MSWWSWLQRRINGDTHRDRAKAEATLRAAQRSTRVIEQMAGHVANLPPEEFADRVAEAFGRRR